MYSSSNSSKYFISHISALLAAKSENGKLSVYHDFPPKTFLIDRWDCQICGNSVKKYFPQNSGSTKTELLTHWQGFSWIGGPAFTESYCVMASLSASLVLFLHIAQPSMVHWLSSFIFSLLVVCCRRCPALVTSNQISTFFFNIYIIQAWKYKPLTNPQKKSLLNSYNVLATTGKSCSKKKSCIFPNKYQSLKKFRVFIWDKMQFWPKKTLFSWT